MASPPPPTMQGDPFVTASMGRTTLAGLALETRVAS
jgi:hypothetical protein